MFALIGAGSVDDAVAVERAAGEWTFANVYGRNPAVVFDTFFITLSSDGRYGFVAYMAGESGGEMLMTKTPTGWKVVFRGGGDMSAEMLENVGVSPTDARRFLAPCPETRRERLPVPPDLRARFATSIRMGPNVGKPTPGVVLCR